MPVTTPLSSTAENLNADTPQQTSTTLPDGDQTRIAGRDRSATSLIGAVHMCQLLQYGDEASSVSAASYDN